MTTRPYRERDVNSILELVKNHVAETGYRNVSLLSLSASDHSQFVEIVERVTRLNLNVSLPSLLASSLTPELVSLIGRGGITLAPEVGTDRLRQRINKPITESQVLESCELAASHGFTHVKLYYMIGLPSETEADIEGIVDLTLRISKVLKGKQINITLSPFVPKSHTPFQWEAQEAKEQLIGKIDYVRGRLRRRNIKIKSTNLQSSIMEGICARGDDRIAQVVEEAYKGGAKFDGWGDKFDSGIWQRAFEEVGINPEECLGQRERDASLPWDMISTGVKNEFMLEERSKVVRTKDCRIQGCYDCGVCQDAKRIVPVHRDAQADISFGRRKRLKPLSKLRLKFRARFEKTECLRFLGHLDLVRAISRAIVRADIPIAYSEGFTKRPRLAFSPPLPFGVTSREEYFDMTLESIPSGDIQSVLNQSLPSGLEVLEVTKLWKEARALSEELKECDYRVEGATPGDKKIEEFMSTEEVMLHDMNIRPFVLNAEEADGSLVLTMKIGKAKPWWIVEYLLGISETEALGFKIERIRYCQPQKDTEKHRM
jgi:radical SAM-linked protein